MTGRIWIGTSGWVYGHWRKLFYPQGLPQSRWFAFYARHFPTVEINATFYREASEEAVRQWRDQAPAGFVYAVKAHRFMTHMKKLVKCEEPVPRFFARMEPLRELIGPVLFQLAPQVPVDLGRLAEFAALLPPGYFHVFEFRDERWYTEETHDFLKQAGLGFCIHDHRGMSCPEWVTAEAAYYRFHGSSGSPPGNYEDEMLKSAAKRINAKASAGHDVWVYFNNDAYGCAIANAKQLMELTPAEQPRRTEQAQSGS